MIDIENTTFIVKANGNLNATLGTIYFDKWGAKTNADVRIVSEWSDIHALKNKKQYVFICNAGFLFLDIRSFFEELAKNPNNIGYGHIINKKNNEYYLYEISMFLESKKIPKTFGTDTVINFPLLERSNDNIHHEHTPLYVKKHKDNIYISQKQLLGQDIIKKYVEEQGLFLNFTNKCRQHTKYLYDQINYKFEDYFLEYKKNCEQTLWIFNNTPFTEINKNQVAMVCSGLIWIVQLLKKESSKIDLYDISSVQIKFAKSLLEHWTGQDYGTFVYEFIIKNKVRTWIIPTRLYETSVDSVTAGKKNFELFKNKDKFIKFVNDQFSIFLKKYFDNFDFIKAWKNKSIENINFYNKDLLEEYHNYDHDAIWATNLTEFKYNFLKHKSVVFKNFEKHIKNEKITIDKTTLYFTKKMKELRREISKKELTMAEDIINESGLPCLKLDMVIPYETILDEIRKIENYFVPHREDNGTGWMSFCIHGKSYDATREDVFYNDTRPHVWTNEANLLMPNTIEYFKNKFPFKKYTRLRIMKLLPGAFINMHRDDKISRLRAINIAINNPLENKFYLEKWGIVDFKPGDAYMLDLSNYHAVYNESKETRYHIIVHGEMSKSMDDIITRSYKKFQV